MHPIECISLDRIRTDGGTQARAALNDATVAEYAETYAELARVRNGFERMPPIVLFYDGSDYWLADGFHRTSGYAQAFTRGDLSAGAAAMLAEVRQGTRRDAVLYACGANAEHGLRRSAADIRRAIGALLRDDEWRQWSDREIARHVRCHHETVGSVRRELEATGEIASSPTRQGADGRTRNAPSRSGAAPLLSLDTLRHAILAGMWPDAEQLVQRLPALPLRGEWGRTLDRARSAAALLIQGDVVSALRTVAAIEDLALRAQLRVRLEQARDAATPPADADDPDDPAAAITNALVPIRARLRAQIADASDLAALEGIAQALGVATDIAPQTTLSLQDHISAYRAEIQHLLRTTTTPAPARPPDYADWQQRAAQAGMDLRVAPDGTFQLVEPNGGLSRYPATFWDGATGRIAHFEQQAAAAPLPAGWAWRTDLDDPDAWQARRFDGIIARLGRAYADGVQDAARIEQRHPPLASAAAWGIAVTRALQRGGSLVMDQLTYAAVLTIPGQTIRSMDWATIIRALDLSNPGVAPQPAAAGVALPAEWATWQARAAALGATLTSSPGGSITLTRPGVVLHTGPLATTWGPITEAIVGGEQHVLLESLQQRAAALGLRLHMTPRRAVRFTRIHDSAPFGGAESLDAAETRIAQLEAQAAPVDQAAPAPASAPPDHHRTETIEVCRRWLIGVSPQGRLLFADEPMLRVLALALGHPNPWAGSDLYELRIWLAETIAARFWERDAARMRRFHGLWDASEAA